MLTSESKIEKKKQNIKMKRNKEKSNKEIVWKKTNNNDKRYNIDCTVKSITSSVESCKNLIRI